MSRPFSARYHGLCPACDEQIEPGELVQYVDDDVVHTDCADHPLPEPKPTPAPCPSCWLVGPCDCEAA